MRYFVNSNTLFISGSFRAASTGICGGISRVSTIVNHSVPPEWRGNDPKKELDLVATAAGYGQDYFGLLTAVPIRNLCVLQYDFVTVFVTAGTGPDDDANTRTINIIVCSGEGISDSALLETIITVTEAKAAALQTMRRSITGTPTDAVIVACEGRKVYEYAGALTPVGKRVYAAVSHGVQKALGRYESGVIYSRTALYIFSRFGEDHWVEWTPEDCPYYPCHFKGQRCDFCYCPLYPCGDETLGQWVESSHGGNVWNCSQCTLLHEPAVADYLKRYPDASKEELLRLYRDKKKINRN